MSRIASSVSAKGKSADEREWMPVEQCKRAQEFVERDGFILCVGRGEMRAGDEAGAQRDEEQYDTRAAVF